MIYGLIAWHGITIFILFYGVAKEPNGIESAYTLAAWLVMCGYPIWLIWYCGIWSQLWL